MTDICPACNSPDPSTCAYAGHKDRPKGCTNTDEAIEARVASLKLTGPEHHHIDFPAEHIQVTLGERKRINDRIDAAYAAGLAEGENLASKDPSRALVRKEAFEGGVKVGVEQGRKQALAEVDEWDRGHLKTDKEPDQ